MPWVCCRNQRHTPLPKSWPRTGPRMRPHFRPSNKSLRPSVLSVPEIAPSAALRAQLLEQIAATPQSAQPTTAKAQPVHSYPLVIKKSSGSDRGNGVLAKLLYKDPVARTITRLYQLAPGTEFTERTHPGAEQCLYLEGDFMRR